MQVNDFQNATFALTTRLRPTLNYLTRRLSRVNRIILHSRLTQMKYQGNGVKKRLGRNHASLTRLKISTAKYSICRRPAFQPKKHTTINCRVQFNFKYLMLSISVNPFLAAVSWISFGKHSTLSRFQGLCNCHSTKPYLCIV